MGQTEGEHLIALIALVGVIYAIAVALMVLNRRW